MKVGDMVKRVVRSRSAHRVGIIVEKVHDPRATANDVFSVLWRDGKIGNNVWDYDLQVINESR